LDAVTTEVYRVLLADAATHKDATRAESLWSELPRSLRQVPDLVVHYAEALRSGGRDDDAESLLRGVLRQRWDDRLALQYGLLKTGDTARQLGRAEAWLRERGDTPVLLLTCGRLCMRSSLWGKARSYLESSIANGPRPDTWHELSKLLQHTGEPESAAECTRKGLLLALGSGTGLEQLPPTRSPVQPRSDTTRPKK
jgi:HemY protein